MSRSSRESFLARWSRRKREAPAEAASPAVPPPAEPPPATLPALDSLDGLASDYRDFMRAGVDDGVRRSALRKLFADPHFNAMDGLDTYIDDYSIESPMTEAMLRGLNQARGLLLLEDESGATPEGAPLPASPAAPRAGLAVAEAPEPPADRAVPDLQPAKSGD